MNQKKTYEVIVALLICSMIVQHVLINLCSVNENDLDSIPQNATIMVCDGASFRVHYILWKDVGEFWQLVDLGATDAEGYASFDMEDLQKGKLINGFYYNILGMTEGQVKIFEVGPSYDSNGDGIDDITGGEVMAYTSGELAGTKLKFQVKITNIVVIPPILPAAPIMNLITPNCSETGNILLSWSVVPEAITYQLYRSNLSIDEINGNVSLIYTGNIASYNDLNLRNGQFHYAETVTTYTGTSNLSNSVSVIVNRSFFIFINGEADFTVANGLTEEGTSGQPKGNGSAGNPYIIENWVIDASAAHGIWINNTNLHVILRNIIVSNGGSSFEGIWLQNANNTVITNITSTNNGDGISLWGANNITITNVTVANNNWGFELEEAHNNTITHITAANNVVGVYMFRSHNNTITHTTQDSNGFCISDSRNNSIDTTNKIDGKSVRYFESQNGIILSGSDDVGQVIFVNTNNSRIENLDISGLYVGILFDDSHNNTITHTTAANNDFGVYLYRSHDNTIMYTNVSANNGEGISLSSSHNNTIIYNTATNNDYGISLTYNSNFNRIWNNNFVANDLYEAFCSGSLGNQWNYDQTGNYYGNYTAQYPSAIHDGRVWNTPYVIAGDAGDQDLYPLVNRTFYIPPPQYSPNAPQILLISPNPNSNGSVSLQWDAVTGATSYNVYRSSSNITSVGSLTPITTTTNITYQNKELGNGTYYYVVTAVNASGESTISNCVCVTVSIPPITNPNNGIAQTNTTTSTSLPTINNISSTNPSDPSVPGYPLLIFSIICSGIVCVLVMRKCDWKSA
jgi:parallel beta-helix repeat protein